VLNPTAVLWTGQEVLVTGWYGLGIAPVGIGGAALDPLTGRWRVLPDGGPSSGGSGAYAWTGGELIEWRGQGWGAGVTYNDGQVLVAS
jgi:hypothetical protein